MNSVHRLVAYRASVLTMIATKIKTVASAKPAVPVGVVRQSVAKVASICAAVMIPIMFSAPEATVAKMEREDGATMDRVVKMEERDIPEIVLRIAEENVANRQAISGLMHIIDQIEDEIVTIEEGNSVGNDEVIEAQMDMLRSMISS